MSAIPITATLRGFTVGMGTNSTWIDEAGISGLGVPAVKSADTVLDQRDGSVGAPDFLDVRAVSIPVVISADTADDAFNVLAELNTAWQPANDGVDLELTLAAVPGWGDVALIGRPRGVDVDTSEAGQGIITALCQFVALQPAFVTP